MSILQELLDLIYPPRCPFCRRLLRKKETPVCPDCMRSLQRVPESAQRRDLKNIELAVAPLYYEGEVRASLLRYKFRGVTAYARAYAGFLQKCIDENEISCDSITWVPLSKRRLRTRGYDQAELLARELAALTGLPCERLLVKTVNNRAQSQTGNAEARKANAAGVYACPCPEKAAGKRILLVDDIITTGATVTECARVLKEAGCGAVFAAAAATRV